MTDFLLFLLLSLLLLNLRLDVLDIAAQSIGDEDDTATTTASVAGDRQTFEVVHLRMEAVGKRRIIGLLDFQYFFN